MTKALGWADPLPHRPGRVLVGIGQDHPRRCAGEFEADVRAFAATDGWVCEWQYSHVRALLSGRADLVVCLDLPRRVVFTSLPRRTLVRRIRRVELRNGNREPPLYTVFTDPDHILRWAWRAFPRAQERMRQLIAAPGEPVVVRLGSRAEAAAWLART